MLKELTVISFVLLIAFTSAHAQDRSQSRSMVASKAGIVASESVLASEAGARILENGGNAIDAAVATNAMMGLVAPMNDGIGGDLFAIVYEAKTGKLYGLNASGWAPERLTADYLLAKGIRQMPQHGINSVTVPGAVAGWDALLKRFGRKSMAEVLAPAISYAENGFPVGEVVSVYWRDSLPLVKGTSSCPRARASWFIGELDFAFLNAPCREAKRFENVFSFEIGIIPKQFVDGPAGPDLANNHSDCHPHSAYTRFAAHDGRILSDSRE